MSTALSAPDTRVQTVCAGRKNSCMWGNIRKIQVDNYRGETAAQYTGARKKNRTMVHLKSLRE